MYSAESVQTIVSKFSGSQAVAPKEKFIRDPEAQVVVPADKLHDVCVFLKSDAAMAFDLPIQMTAVDYIDEKEFELVYYVYSSKNKNGIVVKTRIPREKPSIVSVTDVWNGMDWQEREVFDLFGIEFKNHPNLTRILMWEGFPGFPLRKDYVHVTDRFDSGLEVGTPGHDAKGLPIKKADA